MTAFLLSLFVNSVSLINYLKMAAFPSVYPSRRSVRGVCDACCVAAWRLVVCRRICSALCCVYNDVYVPRPARLADLHILYFIGICSHRPPPPH